MNILEYAVARKLAGGGSGGGSSGGGSSGGDSNIVKGMCEGLPYDIKAENVEFVRESAFNSEHHLRSVDLPNVTSVGVRAFYNCSSLKTVKLGAVTKIDVDAFTACESLEKVDVQSLGTLGLDAFGHCDNVTAFIIRSNTVWTFDDPTAINALPSSLTTGTGNIYVPASQYDGYISLFAPITEMLGVPGFEYVLMRKIEDYPEICG